MPKAPPSNSAEPLSEAEIRSFIAHHLPAWQQACDADDGDSIVLHEASFGTSTYELFPLACAIKYAASKGKHVHVASGIGRINREPETVLLRPRSDSSIGKTLPTSAKQRLTAAPSE